MSGGGDEQAYVRAILDNVADGIITFDERGRVESFNGAAGRIFRCTPSEALARDIHAFVPDPTPDLVTRAGREQTGRRSSGESFPMDVNISETLVDGRKMCIAIVRDVTLRQNLERQLQQAQRLESVGLLARGIAHDFNNILTGIITYAALARRMLGENNKVRDELDEIEQQAQRAATLIKQLLAFSRNQGVEARAVQVGEVLANVRKFVSRVIGETITLEMRIEPGLRDVMADAAQLEQVILNLCVNARDAMPRGGRLTIEAAAAKLDPAFCRSRLNARPGEFIRLSVSDEGQGMPPEVLQRIFEPFFTTKETGKGTGLGLAVVYGIIKQHGGFVDVASEVGRGTTITAYLPPAQRPKPQQVPQQEPAPRGGDETILIAEDERGVRQAATRVLESYGYTVLTAGDGEEAIRVFEDNKARIALVILDAVMPRGGGRELYDTLSASRPQTRFLFVTGYSTSVLGRNFRRARPGHFLQKPFSPEELARRVRAALDERPKR